MTVTNSDLREMLARIEERQITVVEKIADIKNWQTTHQENDTKQFQTLNDNVNGMIKYAASIAIVGTGLGFCVKWLIG